MHYLKKETKKNSEWSARDFLRSWQSYNLDLY